MKHSLFICLVFVIIGCNSKKVQKDQFIGNWKVDGRGILKDVQIKIKKDNKGQLKGYITELNDNKFVNLFMEPGDLFVSSIKRRSMYEFDLTEKRVAGALFSTYGQSSSSELQATFKNKDTILLGKNGAHGKYVRIH